MNKLLEILPKLPWQGRISLLKVVDKDTRNELVSPVSLLDYQKSPAEDWKVWILSGGRGSGKTFAGLQLIKNFIMNVESKSILTFSNFPISVREEEITNAFANGFNPLKKANSLSWPNNSRVTVNSYSDSRMVAGYYNYDLLWFDEPQFSKNFIELFNNIGAKKIFISLTPGALKNTTLKFIKDLLKDESTKISQASSFDNPYISEIVKSNLANNSEITSGDFIV